MAISVKNGAPSLFLQPSDGTTETIPEPRSAQEAIARATSSLSSAEAMVRSFANSEGTLSSPSLRAFRAEARTVAAMLCYLDDDDDGMNAGEFAQTRTLFVRWYALQKQSQTNLSLTLP